MRGHEAHRPARFTMKKLTAGDGIDAAEGAADGAKALADGLLDRQQIAGLIGQGFG